MKQEFPKMLYKGEANTIVVNADEQKAAEKEGFHEFGKEKKKAGRPKKADD